MDSTVAVSQEQKGALEQSISGQWGSLEGHELQWGERYKQYAFEETISFLDKNVTIYTYPSVYVEQFEYDSSGKYVCMQEFSEFPDSDLEMIFTYDNTPDGSVQTGYCYRNSELISRRIVHFDPAGREISLEFVDMNGNTNSWRQTKYDENGNIIERLNGGRASATRVNRYQYDSYGNVISEKKYDYSWNEDIPYETHEYTYIARIR